MLLNPEKEGMVLCPECKNNEFFEHETVVLSERPSDKTIHVTKRYKIYVCSKCGHILKKVQAPV